MTNVVNKQSFQERLKRTRNLFIPFIMAGDPNEDVTVELAYTLQQSGADILELGIPYSDPLADGPTIQEAAGRALQQGMTLKGAIDLVPKIRTRGVDIPIVIFTYYNPVLQYGISKFLKDLQAKDVDGILIPDLPFEESEDIRLLAKTYGIELISLVAPNSEERIKRIAEQATGFLYCVSSLGVTGERKELDQDISSFIKKVKSFSQVPVAVGFGISTPAQVQLMHQHSDGVIIGSKIIRLIKHHQHALMDLDERQAGLKAFQQGVLTLLGNDTQ